MNERKCNESVQKCRAKLLFVIMLKESRTFSLDFSPNFDEQVAQIEAGLIKKVFMNLKLD